MFELLTPVFAVAGGLLAGIPIVLHMLRRTPAEKMPFSAVRFLTPTLPKTTKRSTLEHWPLMLLRILAVALIALAFARPFQRLSIARDAAAGSADRVAVLLDASASMRRDGIRDAVLEQLRSVTSDLNPDDTLSIAAYSNTLRPLVSAEEWRQTEPSGRGALIERAVEGYEPDWLGTSTATAALEAADDVARDDGVAGPDGDRRVVLITDFQQGSRLEEFRSGSWPDGVVLDLRVVKPIASGNSGLSLVEDQRSGRIRVRVTNSDDSPSAKYGLRTFDAAGSAVGTALDADVAPGQRRTFTMPDVEAGQPLIAGVELTGDPHPFDNVVDLPREESAVLRIAHAGATDANDADAMLYYLQRSLDGNETRETEVVQLLAADGLATPVPDDVQLAFVTAAVPEGLTASMSKLVERGGTVVVALASADMLDGVKALLPVSVMGTEADVKDYAMFGQIDFAHPLLTPFADAQFSDFSSIQFMHYRKLAFDTPAADAKDAPRVIAKFDTGDPAMIEFADPSGGRVLLLATGWHRADSQWALSTRFPSMIQRLVQIACPTQLAWKVFETGARVDPFVLTGSEDWTLVDPAGMSRSGADRSGLPEQADPTAQRPTIVLDQPGRWSLSSTGDGEVTTTSLLVTVSATESRTEPLPLGQLQALGLPAEAVPIPTTDAAADASTASQLDAAELEGRQKQWRLLLLAGLGCLALEAIASAWMERRQAAPVAA